MFARCKDASENSGRFPIRRENAFRLKTLKRNIPDTSRGLCIKYDPPFQLIRGTYGLQAAEMMLDGPNVNGKLEETYF